MPPALWGRVSISKEKTLLTLFHCAGEKVDVPSIASEGQVRQRKCAAKDCFVLYVDDIAAIAPSDDWVSFLNKLTAYSRLPTILAD